MVSQALDVPHFWQGIIEVRRISGRYLTKLSYRDLIIYGLRTKPTMITVNENSVPLEGSKTVWDEVNMVSASCF